MWIVVLGVSVGEHGDKTTHGGGIKEKDDQADIENKTARERSVTVG